MKRMCCPELSLCLTQHSISPAVPTCWHCVFFSRISCLRVSNGKQILSHWNSLEGYHIFPKFWQKKGMGKVTENSLKGKDFLSVFSPIKFLPEISLPERWKDFCLFIWKRKILSLLIICPILCHLGNTWSSGKKFSSEADDFCNETPCNILSVVFMQILFWKTNINKILFPGFRRAYKL